MRTSVYNWSTFLPELYPTIQRGCNQYHNTNIALKLFKELSVDERLSNDFDVSKIINSIDISDEMRQNLKYNI